jgi:hypothetical protein
MVTLLRKMPGEYPIDNQLLDDPTQLLIIFVDSDTINDIIRLELSD